MQWVGQKGEWAAQYEWCAEMQWVGQKGEWAAQYEWCAEMQSELMSVFCWSFLGRRHCAVV